MIFLIVKSPQFSPENYFRFEVTGSTVQLVELVFKDWIWRIFWATKPLYESQTNSQLTYLVNLVRKMENFLNINYLMDNEICYNFHEKTPSKSGDAILGWRLVGLQTGLLEDTLNCCNPLLSMVPHDLMPRCWIFSRWNSQVIQITKWRARLGSR